ncbi:hypothetical protein ABIA33_000723 [Streptacidiphilus sp. MAP12-16]|jgi:hypothetical protein|uniref:hypothetical protein n=1 Tax=Streptacidiphilus sp. MAP12-16 TaxID=3156300 RepID=UPI0035128F4F
MDSEDVADDLVSADEVVWAWLTGCPVRGGTVKEQLFALNRMFEIGLLTVGEFVQAQGRLTGEPSPPRPTRRAPAAGGA